MRFRYQTRSKKKTQNVNSERRFGEPGQRQMQNIKVFDNFFLIFDGHIKIHKVIDRTSQERDPNFYFSNVKKRNKIFIAVKVIYHFILRYISYSMST
jgi:hypothetical protein